MQSVICKRNEGYKWYIKDNCWFKGYLQKQDKDIMRGYEAIALIDSLNSYEELLSLLKQYSGLFSIIVKKEKETWLATDIARSMPIYYTTDLTFISDDIESLKSICERSCFELDDIRVLELYTTSFVGFKNTIYKGVKQLELGCAAKMKDGTITEIPYFIHSSGIKELNLEDAIKDFRNLTTNMIKRMVSVVGDRQIVLSLSGGYDSRYLACSLKDQGINNVICYTYGRSDSFEVAQ